MPNANTAVAGIYYRMTNISNGINPSFNGMMTLYPALSADELYTVENYYFINAIPTSEDKFWGSIYGVVYDANAVIEGPESIESAD